MKNADILIKIGQAMAIANPKLVKGFAESTNVDMVLEEYVGLKGLEREAWEKFRVALEDVFDQEVYVPWNVCENWIRVKHVFNFFRKTLRRKRNNGGKS